jgi:hypothetical protein
MVALVMTGVALICCVGYEAVRALKRTAQGLPRHDLARPKQAFHRL